MNPIINALYINAQYAEIPPRDLPKLVEKSYRPVLKALLKRHKEKFLLGITGRSIEIFQKDYPDVLRLIQALVKKDVFEIVGGTYSNPVLSLLTHESRNRQIESHQFLVKKYFAKKPRGFHLPEFSWDPTMAETLKKFSYRWTIILQHQIDFSKRPNVFAAVLSKRPNYSADVWGKVMHRSLIRRILTLPKIQILFNRELKIPDHRPFYIQGTNSEIIGLKTIRTWTGFVIAATANKILQTRSKLKELLAWQSENAQGLFMPFFGDVENINFQGNSPIKFNLDNFLFFLDSINANKNLFYQFPEKFLVNNLPTQEIYIKTSSGEPSASLDIWERDPDSMRLENLCREIRDELKHTKNKKVRAKAEHYLMLAENGDGRGWNPVPERKLACFEAAICALEILDG